jgi:hypothetical protein
MKQCENDPWNPKVGGIKCQGWNAYVLLLFIINTIASTALVTFNNVK